MSNEDKPLSYFQQNYTKFRIYYANNGIVKFFEQMTTRKQAKRYAHLCQVFNITYSVEF